MEFKPNDIVKVLPGEFTDGLCISGKTGRVQQRDALDGYYLIDVDHRWYVLSEEMLQLVSRPEDDKSFWEAAVAFLYSERERHLEDIDAIDRKIYLIRDHHGIDIQSIMAADFLDEEMIKGKVKHP